jgi:hypothetical protein
MKPIIYLVIAGLALAAWPPAVRTQEMWPLFDGCRWSVPSLCNLWRQRECWALDDYCAKRLPCTTPRVGGCIDDYHGKPLPCVPCNVRGCVDDYCPKQCPILLRGNCEPWYTGGPQANGPSCVGPSSRHEIK